MPSLIDIRRRIRSVKNTQQITRAMKMVSSAKLRRAQDRVLSARPYARMLGELIADVGRGGHDRRALAAHPLLARREEKRIQLMLITSDRGLAGAFNSNLIKAAQQIPQRTPGDRGRSWSWSGARAATSSASAARRSPASISSLADKARLRRRRSDRRPGDGAVSRAGEVDAVYVLYNEFKSVLSQRLTVDRVLPLELPEGEARIGVHHRAAAARAAGGAAAALRRVTVHHALLESTAAEQAARMTAMDAATTNAAELIDKLTLYMNRVRQASITREIIEVVSGANAAVVGEEGSMAESASNTTLSAK